MDGHEHHERQQRDVDAVTVIARERDEQRARTHLSSQDSGPSLEHHRIDENKCKVCQYDGESRVLPLGDHVVRDKWTQGENAAMSTHPFWPRP